MTVSSYQVSWIRPSVDDGLERLSKIFSSAQTNLESTHSKFVTRTHLCESHNEVKTLLFSIAYLVWSKDQNCDSFQNGLALFSLGLEASEFFHTRAEFYFLRSNTRWRFIGDRGGFPESVAARRNFQKFFRKLHLMGKGNFSPSSVNIFT